jgi:hypothetical protein
MGCNVIYPILSHIILIYITILGYSLQLDIFVIYHSILYTFIFHHPILYTDILYIKWDEMYMIKNIYFNPISSYFIHFYIQIFAKSPKNAQNFQN